MMKSFFKKLAFVMALAMVVTLAAPAAKSAVAATEKKPLAIAYQEGAVITALNLKSVGATEDLRFVYAPANWKELGVKWTSSNENVVTVDSNGVVKAEAAGKATISVAVGTETASIDVYSVDMMEFAATIGSQDGTERSISKYTMKVDEEFDFRFFGIYDYDVTRYDCVWLSLTPDVATVDQSGLVKAIAPGTAAITLSVSNQVVGKTYVVAPVVITVEAEEPEATPAPVDIVAEINKTQNTIEVTFPEATTIGLSDVEMYRVFSADDDNNGDGIIDERDAFEPYQDFYVYGVAPNSAKTVWTLTTFDDFTDGATYEVRVKGYDPERFVASVGDVAKVEVYEKSGATLASEEGDVDAIAATLGVNLYDAKGVNVTTRVVNGIPNNDASNISYELTTESDAYSLYDNEIMFYEYAAASVRGIYDNYEITKPIQSTPITVRPSSVKAYGVAEVVAWTIVDEDDNNAKIDWNGTLQKTVPAGEDSYVIVTLLKDTRGNYFSTHQKGCVNKYVDANGVKHTVSHTENSEAAFWINGCYVQYKAMSPDKMLVETDGTIQSYEKGTARFALYLYDYNKQTVDGFVKELYSQNLTVCHEKKLSGFNVDGSSDLNIMMKTKAEAVDNAYYTPYSEGFIKIQLTDIHGGDAKADHAADAKFKVTLTNDINNDILKAFVSSIESTLNGIDTVKRTVSFGAYDFAGYTGSSVRFKITETTTGAYKNVTITLTQPAELDGNSAKVHTVDEYNEDMSVNVPFEKFVASTGNFTVEQAITDYKNDASVKNNGYNILLNQVDKKNNPIGVDSNLYLATSANIKKLTISNVVNVSGATGSALNAGDRVMVVTGPDGSVFNLSGNDFGATIRFAGTAIAEDGRTATDYNQYGLVFRSVIAPEYDASNNLLNPDEANKVIYAKNGKYTIKIYTVEEDVSDPDEVINFAESTGLNKTIVATVVNNNPTVTYAGRDKIRLEGSASSVNEQDILDAFNFNLGGKLWEEAASAGTGKLDATDILDFTYTIAATNNQVVINTVTFKVPVMGIDNSTDDANRYGWYPVTVTVNKSITFE